MIASVRRMTAADRGALLAINAQNVPHVAALDAAELARLLDMRARIYVAVIEGGEPVGYLIAFDRTCPYDGEEFLGLQQAIGRDFLYVDQVAVAAPLRGTGVGRALYDAAEASARAGAWLCCEVNERPPNPGSQSFHAAMGFEKLRSMETRDGRTVALLARQR